jgi:hypothetical protein
LISKYLSFWKKPSPLALILVAVTVDTIFRWRQLSAGNKQGVSCPAHP